MWFISILEWTILKLHQPYKVYCTSIFGVNLIQHDKGDEYVLLLIAIYLFLVLAACFMAFTRNMLILPII